MHAYIHTCIHAYMHTCIHAYMHTCIHTYIHIYTHTYIHTYKPTYIPTYIHTDRQTYIYIIYIYIIYMCVCVSISWIFLYAQWWPPNGTPWLWVWQPPCQPTPRASRFQRQQARIHFHAPYFLGWPPWIITCFSTNFFRTRSLDQATASAHSIHLGMEIECAGQLDKGRLCAKNTEMVGRPCFKGGTIGWDA